MPTRVGYAISAVDTTPIFYEIFGGEDGTVADEELPLVLCDGIGCDGFIWKYFIPRFSRNRTVIHWHYRGHGRSPVPKEQTRASIADLSDDLASVLDDAGIEQAVLVGHSMGVQVALEFHQRHRYRTKGLILMCGTHSELLKTFKGSDLLEVALPAMRKTIERAPKLFSSIGRTVLPREWLYRLGTKWEFREEFLSQQDFMPYLKGLSQLDPVFFLSMLAEAGEYSAREFLGEIRVPSLVVAGEVDTFTPPDLSRELAQLIPGAELCIVHQGTHSTPLEHPDIVGQVVENFLSRLQI